MLTEGSNINEAVCTPETCIVGCPSATRSASLVITERRSATVGEGAAFNFHGSSSVFFIGADSLRFDLGVSGPTETWKPEGISETEEIRKRREKVFKLV